MSRGNPQPNASRAEEARTWSCERLEDITRHVVATCHPDIAAALRKIRDAIAEDRADVRAALQRVEAEVRVLLAREERTVFPEVLALERARLGEGPWPDGSELRALVAGLCDAEARCDGLVADLRARAHALPDAAKLLDAVDALERALARRARLEHGELFPRAIALEPDRRLVPRH